MAHYWGIHVLLAEGPEWARNPPKTSIKPLCRTRFQLLKVRFERDTPKWHLFTPSVLVFVFDDLTLFVWKLGQSVLKNVLYDRSQQKLMQK